MKLCFAGCALSALVVAGCSSTGPGPVAYNQEGVRTYHLDSMPQANISGTGTLMPGAYSNGQEMNHGRFSGQERTMTGVGQRPILAAGEDSREYARGEEPATRSTDEQPSIAGRLGNKPPEQQVILITPSSAAVSALTTSGAGVSGAAPTLNAPLSSGASGSALGRPASTETGIATSIDSSDDGSTLARSDAEMGPLDVSISPRDTWNTELTTRVRDALTTGRPGAITTLTPDRLGQLRIEAQNGNVTLRGTANSETEKLLLGQRIGRIQGVSSVNNQLRVISPTRTEMNDASDPARRSSPVDQFDKRSTEVPQ